MITLLSLRVRRKRDLVLARQRARQIGRLLGLDATGQATLACGVFEMAYRSARQLGPVRVEFRLADGTLQVSFARLPGKTLSIRPAAFPDNMAFLETLVPHPPAMPEEDLVWAVRQVAEHAPLDCFQEMRQQSQELLRALVQLRRAETRQDPPEQKKAAA
jgi:hypothetical protein